MLLMLAVVPEAMACTTAIISGRYTIDGRPLMLKNRDSSRMNNVYVSGDSAKYAWIAVVPIEDDSDRGVMYGQNEVVHLVQPAAEDRQPAGPRQHHVLGAGALLYGG